MHRKVPPQQLIGVRERSVCMLQLRGQIHSSLFFLYPILLCGSNDREKIIHGGRVKFKTQGGRGGAGGVI
jgi:hypothetical protein